MESAKKKSRSNSLSSIESGRGGTAGFAVCIDNRGYGASLEKGKLYRVIPDPQASSHGYLRVIDEEGEDYAYAARRFFPVKIPVALERSLGRPPRAARPD